MHAANRMKDSVPMILAGDFKVAPTGLDIIRYGHGMETHCSIRQAGRPSRRYWTKAGLTHSDIRILKDASNLLSTLQNWAKVQISALIYVSPNIYVTIKKTGQTTGPFCSHVMPCSDRREASSAP